MAKRILFTPKKREDEPPSNFPSSKSFVKRVAEINPAVVSRGNQIILFPRVIYDDGRGLNSMITKREGIVDDGKIILSSKVHEEVVFVADEKHGCRGIEDLRIGKVEGETVAHGFPVCYDGLTARTMYKRTHESDPQNLLSWQDFGIIFPNIEAGEAISCVGNETYKEWWRKQYDGDMLEKRIIELKREGFLTPEEILLGAKDGCAYSKRVNGKYTVIVGLKPHMQIVYVDGWEQLADRNFWCEVINDIDNHTLLEARNPKLGWIGLAGTPFEIKEGTVIPYHTGTMNPERIYTGEFALVNSRTPQNVIARTKKSILEATEPWERDGLVSGKVVFPTGHILGDNEETIYTIYGAGDVYTAYTSMKKSDFLERMESV